MPFYVNAAGVASRKLANVSWKAAMGMPGPVSTARNAGGSFWNRLVAGYRAGTARNNAMYSNAGGMGSFLGGAYRGFGVGASTGAVTSLVTGDNVISGFFGGGLMGAGMGGAAGKIMSRRTTRLNEKAMYRLNSLAAGSGGLIGKSNSSKQNTSVRSNSWSMGTAGQGYFSGGRY